MSDPERFRERYQDTCLEDLPWFHSEPDPDLLTAFDRVLEGPSRVLDLGAGPAVNSIWLAARGHEVVAVDAIDRAKDMALALAADRGATLEYLVHDALDIGHLAAFDMILDRGFMHTLSSEHRPAWRRAVSGALRVGGHVVVKCFDVRPTRDFGPAGLTAVEVIETLGDPDLGGMELVNLERTTFPGELERHATWTAIGRRVS